MKTVLRVSPPASEPVVQDRAAELAARVEELEAERETLLQMVSHLQRVSQSGLITSALAHDVSNHIQVISGTAYLATMRENPDEWEDALHKIQDQCVALTETTQSFLGFVRRRGSIASMSFTLSKVMEETCRLVQPLARTNQVELSQSVLEDAEVRGEPRLAIQALVNIVSNAARACGDLEGNGKVAVSATCPSPDSCRLTVVDNGPGIPEEMRQRLFRPFTSGEIESGGNGIGLFIVRRTVRELGGLIRVRTSSEGTTFQIDLPRRR